uniref:Uncharacterized protein n=1 Tax=Lepeophtheirus salmonis TaxID=72036 RepID=A0A0K2TE79_LEPSM
MSTHQSGFEYKSICLEKEVQNSEIL